MTMTISEHVGRYVAIMQKLGYRYTRCGQVLYSFARFAEARNERFIRSETAIEWASASAAALNASGSCMQHTASATGCTPRTFVTKCRLAMPWAGCRDGGRRPA